MPCFRNVRTRLLNIVINNASLKTGDVVSTRSCGEERPVARIVVVEAEEAGVLLFVGHERRLIDDEPRAQLGLGKTVRRRTLRHKAGGREPKRVVRRRPVGGGQRVLRHRHRARVSMEIGHCANRSLVDPVRHGAALVRDDARVRREPDGDVLRPGCDGCRRRSARDRHGVVARLERAGCKCKRNSAAGGRSVQARVDERLRRVGAIEQAARKARDAGRYRRPVHGHRHRRHRGERALHAPHARDA